MGMLDNKVIVVTGATSGIGKATAIEIANQGGIPVIAGRREDRGAAVVGDIEAAGGKALFVRTDVTVEADIKHLIDETVKTFGRLDGAFNNAGSLTCVGPLDTVSNDDYQSLLDLNVKSVFWSMKYEVAAMKEHGGAIVNCSSTAGIVTAPNFGIYVSTKHNLIGLTKSAAADYAGYGIRVNCVLPGAVDTEIWHPYPDGSDWMAALSSVALINRPAQAEEIAKPVAFLLSDGASYMTGAQIPIDGGYTAL